MSFYHRLLNVEFSDQDAARFLVRTLDVALRGLRVPTEDRGRFCAAGWFAMAVANCSLNALSSVTYVAFE